MFIAMCPICFVDISSSERFNGYRWTMTRLPLWWSYLLSTEWYIFLELGAFRVFPKEFHRISQTKCLRLIFRIVYLSIQFDWLPSYAYCHRRSFRTMVVVSTGICNTALASTLAKHRSPKAFRIILQVSIKDLPSLIRNWRVALVNIGRFKNQKQRKIHLHWTCTVND